jgi:Flp pilus assembly protein TadG
MMKKIGAIIAGILLLAGCNKNLNVDIAYTLTANIDVSTVVNYAKWLDGSLVFEDSGKLSESDQIILSYIIYDKDGKAVVEEKSTLPNFKEKTTIAKSLQPGSYTVTACVYIKGQNTEWWKQEGQGQLKDYRITYNDNTIGASGVLGFYKEAITFEKSKTLSVGVLSAVGFMLLDFDYVKEAGIQRMEYILQTWNKSLNAADGLPSFVEENSYTFSEQVGEYRNLLANWSYLPAPKFTVTWKGYGSNGTVVKSGTVPSSAVEAGTTKVITINTVTGNATTTTKSLAPTEQKAVKGNGQLTINN